MCVVNTGMGFHRISKNDVRDSIGLFAGLVVFAVVYTGVSNWIAGDFVFNGLGGAIRAVIVAFVTLQVILWASVKLL